jgi:hypothetical protein
MITDERTSRTPGQAKQHRADVVGNALTTQPAALVFVLALAALVTTISWTPDVTTASHGAGQVAEVSKR